jgi:hypothetical protein
MFQKCEDLEYICAKKIFLKTTNHPARFNCFKKQLPNFINSC